jgi:SAM-dependent methyltransferase
MSSRQPTLILRESCIADVTRSWPPGSFIEVGAGTGYMTSKFLNRGFHGACYDLGDESRQRLRENLAPYRDRMAVVDDLGCLTPASFDYLFAFEVLEHIDDDEAALQDWTRYLRPNGRIMLTVPAHARKYGKSDEVVGHIRRYERHELMELLTATGYSDIHLSNYGFPLTSVTRMVSNLLVAREREHLNLSPVERSLRSSFSRPKNVRNVLGSLDERMFAPFKALQRIFYGRDWGDGLLAVASRSDTPH